MLEVLFLLLPIAASYGWYMGRRSMRQQQQKHQKAINKDYFSGLNFLLFNESDKDIESLIQSLDVNTNNIDTHLSLGALFRTRGEVDRAIQIHQGVIAHCNLDDEQIEQAFLALAKDYLAAGFHDRAEDIFLKLLDQCNDTEEAESQLVALYQTTKEWQKAINVIKGMTNQRKKGYLSIIAHLYCQLSEESDDIKIKLKLLKQALRYDKHCGRAILQLMMINSESSNFKAFEKLIYQLLEADVELVAEGLEIALTIYRRNNALEHYDAFLHEAMEKGAGASVIMERVKLLVEQSHASEAEQLLISSLHHHPTMKVFNQLMRIYIEKAEEGSAKQSLSVLEQLVEQQIKYRPSYRCQGCGFPAHKLYWYCPSCKSWGKIKRICGLDGE